MFPVRFATGIHKTTIANPYTLYSGERGSEVYQGDVGGYDFKWQIGNFLRLNEVLKANDTELGPLVAATYAADHNLYSNPGTTRNLTRFVSCSKDGSLMWEKYEGNTPGGGQNYVYVAGRKIKLTVFLEMEEGQQRALLSGNELLIRLAGIPHWADVGACV